MKAWAVSWLICSVCIERITHSRSAWPRLAVLLETHERAPALELGVLQLGQLLPLRERFWKRLAVEGLEGRLPVERLQLRGAARHAEEDHPLGLDRKMRLPERPPPVGGLGQAGRRRRLPFAAEHRQGDAPQAVGALVEKTASAND